MKFAYLIGEPGVGKTTLMNAVITGLPWFEASRPFKHLVFDLPNGTLAAHLGPYRPPFSGTDGLSMSVQPQVVDWMGALCPYEIVVGEGDRLANPSFFEATGATVVLVEAADGVAAERRNSRAAREGKAQNESWVAGRVTKVANLRPYVQFVVDSEAPLADQLDILRGVPAFTEILEGRA